MTIENIKQEDLDNKVSTGLKLVDLWAPWCGSCKMISPTVDTLASEYQGELGVLKIDIDEEEGITEKLDVMSIPTLILFKDGKEVDRLTGFKSKEVIENMIKGHK